MGNSNVPISLPRIDSCLSMLKNMDHQSQLAFCFWLFVTIFFLFLIPLHKKQYFPNARTPRYTLRTLVVLQLIFPFFLKIYITLIPIHIYHSSWVVLPSFPFPNGDRDLTHNHNKSSQKKRSIHWYVFRYLGLRYARSEKKGLSFFDCTRVQVAWMLNLKIEFVSRLVIQLEQ